MENNATGVVTVSVILICGTTAIRKVKTNDWKEGDLLRIAVFGFLLAIALQTMAVVSPGFAKALGYLGLVGAFVVNGPTVFKLIGDLGR